MDDFQNIGADDFGRWGVLDGQLLEQSLVRLKELEQGDQPYLFSLLTVGTHGPLAEIAKECRGENEPVERSNILEGVACSARLVDAFVQEAEKIISLDDTIIVLISDHLAHPKVSAYWDLKDHERTNTFIAFGGGINQGVISKIGSSIDVFPTLLDLIHLPVRGQSAGLGRSLLSSKEGWSTGQSDFQMRKRLLNDHEFIEYIWNVL